MFVNCDALKRVDQVLGYSKALIVVRGSSRWCRLLIAPRLSLSRPIGVCVEPHTADNDLLYGLYPLSSRHFNLLL